MGGGVPPSPRVYSPLHGCKIHSPLPPPHVCQQRHSVMCVSSTQSPSLCAATIDD